MEFIILHSVLLEKSCCHNAFMMCADIRYTHLSISCKLLAYITLSHDIVVRLWEVVLLYKCGKGSYRNVMSLISRFRLSY